MSRKYKKSARPISNLPDRREFTPPRSDAGGKLAPWPAVDKYPTVIGSSLTLQYLSTVYRNAQTGYRREYVDALDELLERDPHAYACLSQRVFAVAGARLSMEPAKCEQSEERRAKELAVECEKVILSLHQRRQSFASLLWHGVFYGVGGSEIDWDKSTDDKWTPTRLHWIHSRRLAYPDPISWDVHIWDMGMVQNWGDLGNAKTNELFGLKPVDFPGKFIVHSPQLRGDYPTRDGVGREIAYWMAIKLMGARGFAQFVERFGKPWPIGYFATTKEGEKNPRAATTEDIQALEYALGAVGAGSLGRAALPDSVKADLGGLGSNALPRELPQAALIRVANAEISKAVLGNSDTIESSQNGSRSATETRRESNLEIYRYDAACLSDTLKRDLIWWYIHLNYPGEEHLCPTPALDVEPAPDRKVQSEIILAMAQSGAPMDADAEAMKVGVTLIPNLTKEPRRLGFCKADFPITFDPELSTPVAPKSQEPPEPDDDKPAKKPAKKAQD